jgi:hypothetical protein
MTFAQWRNRRRTHFSECILVDKRRIFVLSSCSTWHITCRHVSFSSKRSQINIYSSERLHHKWNILMFTFISFRGLLSKNNSFLKGMCTAEDLVIACTSLKVCNVTQKIYYYIIILLIKEVGVHLCLFTAAITHQEICIWAWWQVLNIFQPSWK